jgi:hypothetical protein
LPPDAFSRRHPPTANVAAYTGSKPGRRVCGVDSTSPPWKGGS